MLEKLLEQHCGPALAGIKPGNLLTCIKADMPKLRDDIRRLNYELNKKDIHIDIICECDRSMLLFVYRRDVLSAYINSPDINMLLKRFGYGRCESAESYINTLKTHLKQSEFPHEIGAFLGYPADDIYGFIKNKGKSCLVSGEWKVYKNAEAATRLFERYRCCRRAILKRLEAGKTIAQKFCAA